MWVLVSGQAAAPATASTPAVSRTSTESARRSCRWLILDPSWPARALAPPSIRRNFAALMTTRRRRHARRRRTQRYSRTPVRRRTATHTTTLRARAHVPGRTTWLAFARRVDPLVLNIFFLPYFLNSIFTLILWIICLFLKKKNIL